MAPFSAWRRRRQVLGLLGRGFWNKLGHELADVVEPRQSVLV
ncbi:hypothetical protein ACFWVP_34000 [Streptomyces sp. NPDC058637]